MYLVLLLLLLRLLLLLIVLVRGTRSVLWLVLRLCGTDCTTSGVNFQFENERGTLRGLFSSFLEV
jgi:hypothetical protein